MTILTQKKKPSSFAPSLPTTCYQQESSDKVVYYFVEISLECEPHLNKLRQDRMTRCTSIRILTVNIEWFTEFR